MMMHRAQEALWSAWVGLTILGGSWAAFTDLKPWVYALVLMIALAFGRSAARAVST